MDVASNCERATMDSARSKPVVCAIFIVWSLVCLTAIGSLTVGHWYTLPRPSAHDPRLVRALDAQRLQLGTARGWMATHVLYARCACSRRVVDALIARGPVSPFREVVLSVDGKIARAESLLKRGFTLRTTSAADLHRVWGVEAGPLLVVAGPDGAVRYIGGYTERAQGPAFRDHQILERISAGASVSPLPAFGCAVSDALQRLADPWGLKYRWGGDAS